MDIATYREIAGRGELLDADELQAWMREQATEAQRITAEINGRFHTPEELRALVARLTGSEPGEGFCLFPPIYADFGKNLFFGKNVFVNSGCCFQDQGGIYIGDNVCFGPNVSLMATNHPLLPQERPDRRRCRNGSFHSHHAYLQKLWERDHPVSRTQGEEVLLRCLQE